MADKWQQAMLERKKLKEAAQKKKERRARLIGISACIAVAILVAVIVILTVPKKTESTSSAAGTVATDAPADTTPAAPTEKTVDMNEIKQQIDSMQLSDFTETDEVTEYVRISVEDYGDIVVRLCPETAPISAENFQTLVADRYYDGVSFHRVYPGFMIQGGDGADAANIKGEFSANGVQNDLSHVRGVLSMARATPPDSGSSQFFICHADSDFLDGNYAAFGYVVAGMSTVDAICEVELEPNAGGEMSSPVTPVIITSAVFVKP